MAFTAIDAKADVADSKKGKLTPAQHAQLNAWCLASKTGILDWGDKCVSTADSYSVSNGEATVAFKKGYIVICGRLVECDANTEVSVSAPVSGSVNGKIILRYDLSNSGNDEFIATTTTSDLTQQDLNDNPLTGVYEFELYSYTATPTTVTLTRTNTDYIPDIGGKLQQFITVLTGTGMTGTGSPPLQGYNKTKGTIEERLTRLGFKSGGATKTGIYNQVSVTHLTRQGNYVILKLNASQRFYNAQSVLYTGGTLFYLPEHFKPISAINMLIGGKGACRSGDDTRYDCSCYFTLSISTNGHISISKPYITDSLFGTDSNICLNLFNIDIGYEASPIA